MRLLENQRQPGAACTQLPLDSEHTQPGGEGRPSMGPGCKGTAASSKENPTETPGRSPDTGLIEDFS